jgi:transposase
MGTKKKRRVFSEEFKHDAVKRAQTADQPLTQTARELGISISLLDVWRRKYGSKSPEAATTAISLEEENRRLRRENASLREDREVLKKAAAFFAKESR